MTNIINIFHEDILPVDVPSEYEMTGIWHSKPEVLFYRQGLSPALATVTQGQRVTIPLLPVDGSLSISGYKTNRELKYEITRFIVESIPFLRTQDMRIVDAANLASKIFTDQGTYLCHALYSSDLENRIGPLYDYMSETKCIDLGRDVKNTLIFLPEEIFTGILPIKDQCLDSYRSIYGYTNSRGRFGVMLSKDNALMCRPN